jgi:hypothetical protein
MQSWTVAIDIKLAFYNRGNSIFHPTPPDALEIARLSGRGIV